MRRMIVALALAGLMVAGCRVNHTPLRASGERSGNGQPNAVNGAITAVGLFGGAQVEVKNYPNLCAGRATLNGGSAEIKDSCFSGDTNVVICTDVTNVSAVRCTPANGALSIGGSGSDVIAYARVK